MEINTNRIASIMAEQQLTQKDVASKCGLSAQCVCAIMKKGTCLPLTVGMLARGLGVPVDELLGEDL